MTPQIALPMTVRKAAGLLGLTTARVYQLIEEQRLQPAKVGEGSTVHVTRESVEKLMADREERKPDV